MIRIKEKLLFILHLMDKKKKIPFVIPITPWFAPTINITKSGAQPVNPKTVVFKYFSCPQRSMNVMIFEELWQICCQLILTWFEEALAIACGLGDSVFDWGSWIVTISPVLENPRISWLILLVLPVSLYFNLINFNFNFTFNFFFFLKKKLYFMWMPKNIYSCFSSSIIKISPS